MPLIPCPDCGREISDRAPACIGCGAPIASAGVVTPGIGTDVRQKVEIEATNRGLKNQMLFALLLSLGGCAGMVSASSPQGSVLGAAAVIIGLLWWLIARIVAWYRNG